MSRLPLDIVNFNDEFQVEVENAIIIGNGIQKEFIFNKVPNDVTRKFQFLNFDEIDSDEFLAKAAVLKKELKGFYPYLCFLTNSPVSGGGWSNLFADADLENGTTIITTDNVPDTIVPKDKLTSYFIYYFTRTITKFVFKDVLNHSIASPKGCLFDFMENKTDILKSMRPNAICDNCKRIILKGNYSFSEQQLNAIDILLSKSGALLKATETKVNNKRRIFIGSSTEGLDVARKIKAALKFDAHVDTWADGLFEKPGQAYIEVLENVLSDYEFAIFVFTPDDNIFSRGTISKIPRDNVIFEYGMFLGKHTRRKAFFIVPRGVDIKIMTDVLGITSLDYDPTNVNLQSAVSDACDQIRAIINQV